MKKIKYSICVLLAVLLTTGSCTKDFSAINTNPNTAEKVLPQNLLERALIKTIDNNMERSRTFNNELMQVTVNTLVEVDRIFRYDIRRNVAEAPWNNWYLQLTNIKDMYKLAEENTADANRLTYMGISLVLQAWIHSMITDTYGDSPYTEANKGKEGIYTPIFDTQKDIYAGMFEQLEEANVLLNGAKNIGSGYDPVFAGNASKWRKFGNSLYLRLLMRLSGKAEVSNEVIAKIQQIVDEEPYNYPMMVSNDDSAFLKWTGVTPRISPWVTMRDQSWSYPKMCSFFVERLDMSSDPCIANWVTLKDGLYEGIPSGYISGATPDGRSLLPQSLRSHEKMGNMLNYAEVQFMLAEASLKGWVTSKSTKEYYDAGVTARITYWGRAVGSYLSGAMVAWDDMDTFEEKMEKIFWQKYLSLFMTDMQSWIEYRRTGYPVLPKGPGLMNDGVMPTRLFYPLSVQATNVQNYNIVIERQGADDLKTMVWWQKP